jgi:hypothetical protein
MALCIVLQAFRGALVAGSGTTMVKCIAWASMGRVTAYFEVKDHFVDTCLCNLKRYLSIAVA